MGVDMHECRGCTEYRALSRRGFMSRARSVVGAAVTAPAWLPRVVMASAENTSRDTLIVVFLRGGVDGLSVVVPYGDPNLYAPNLRPNIVVQPPGATDGAVDLDGFFGLSPAMAPLLPAFQSGQLAIVQATGSPDPSRSHFSAQVLMEFGTPLQPNTSFEGWIAKHLGLVPPAGLTSLRAIALNDILPASLTGANGAIPIPDPANASFPGQPFTAPARRAAIESSYLDFGGPLASSAQGVLDALDLLATIDFDHYVPDGGAMYQNTSFGRALSSLAAMIKADIGLEVGTIDLGGWDTHNEQGVFTGGMSVLMNNLSSNLAAFHTDMQTQMNGLTVLVMSEFGRRADENVSKGTDHGHGNFMLAMGGNIAGGQVIANWTDGELLHPDLLYQGDSLDVTIDYRDIVSEVLQNRLDNPDLAAVFANYTPTFQGITV